MSVSCDSGESDLTTLGMSTDFVLFNTVTTVWRLRFYVWTSDMRFASPHWRAPSPPLRWDRTARPQEQMSKRRQYLLCEDSVLCFSRCIDRPPTSTRNPAQQRSSPWPPQVQLQDRVDRPRKDRSPTVRPPQICRYQSFGMRYLPCSTLRVVGAMVVEVVDA